MSFSITFPLTKCKHACYTGSLPPDPNQKHAKYSHVFPTTRLCQRHGSSPLLQPGSSPPHPVMGIRYLTYSHNHIIIQCPQAPPTAGTRRSSMCLTNAPLNKHPRLIFFNKSVFPFSTFPSSVPFPSPPFLLFLLSRLFLLLLLLCSLLFFSILFLL